MQLLTQKSLPVLVLLAFSASLALAEESFHAPRSATERALDDILWHADNDRGLLDYVFAEESRNTTRDSLYAKSVTKGFRASIVAYEKTLKKNTCDGKFRSGRMCGYDANPFTCKQDVGEYLYLTKKTSNPSVTIAAIWEDQIIQDEQVQYRLVKENSVWKIDGVLCYNGPNFNFKKK